MSHLSLLCLTLWLAAAGATEADCARKNADESSLLQLSVKDDQGSLVGRYRGGAEVAERSLHSLADTAEDVQAARASTNAAMGYEAQAAELLRLAYREVQQAEDIQESRVYQEANVTQILHEAVTQVQASQPGDITLLQSLRHAEMAQAGMLKDASQEDQALAGLRSAMASAAQAATSAKLVDETQTVRTLEDAMSKIQEGGQLVKDLPRQMLTAEAHTTELEAQLAAAKTAQATTDAHAFMLQTTQAREVGMKVVSQERAAAAADRHNAEVARQEASAMYQAATSTQQGLQTQATRTWQSLMKVASEASQAAQSLQGALATSRPVTTAR